MSWAIVLGARNPGNGFDADSAGSESAPPALLASQLGSLGIFVIEATHTNSRLIESDNCEGVEPAAANVPCSAPPGNDGTYLVSSAYQDMLICKR